MDLVFDEYQFEEIDRIIGALEGTADGSLWNRNHFSSGTLPAYLGPPTADGYNESASESHEPALTRTTTDASSYLPHKVPSLGVPPRDPGPSQYGFDATQPETNFETLKAPQVDLQYIGEAPEIFVQGQPARPPDLTQEADLPGSLSPAASRHGRHVPRPRNPSVNAPPPMLSALGGASATSQPVDIPLSAPSMSRDGSRRSGRNHPLPEHQRSKVAGMRKTGACHRCRILKRECDQGSPCALCDRDIHGHPRVCDRARMAELLPGEDQPSVWQAELAETMPPINYYTAASDPVRVSLGFDPDPSDSPDLILCLQQYGHGTSSGLEQYYRPPYTIPAVPLTTAGDWIGTLPGAQSLQAAEPLSTQPLWTGGSWHGYSSPETCYRLHPHERPSADTLLAWAEKQVRQDLARHQTFEAAIGIFTFTLRDRPLPVPPAPERAGRNKNKTTPLSSRYLLRNVCDMMSWLRILQAQALYVRQWPDLGPCGGAGGGAGTSCLLEAVLSDLKWLALAELIGAERRAVENLDLFLNTGIKGVEVPVLACLWRMILIYRQQIAAYTASASIHATMPRAVATALDILYQLHRILLVKYGAYFRSSSPFYPRRGHPSTLDRLQNDQQLKRAWQNVLKSREDFDREICASMAPSDDLLRLLIVEVEHDLGRRRLQKRPSVRRPPPPPS